MDVQLEYIDSIVNALIEEHAVPGACIALVKDGQVIKVGGYGFSNPQQKVPVTSETKFLIGSLTKAFTATVLASILQHRTDVTWDTPVKQILGEQFEFVDPVRTERCCLRDLLAQKVGVELGESDWALVCGPMTREQVASRLKHLPTASDFRTKFHYNNLMYVLAGQVAEALTGCSWEDLVQERIFSVLGMCQSTFMDHAKPEEEDFAIPHMGVNKQPIPIDFSVHRSIGFAGPAGSICSTATDMAKWMLFHLQNGYVDGIPMIKSQLLKECYKPQFALPSGMPDWDGYAHQPDFPVTETRDTYGFGWYRGTYRGYRTLAHPGEYFGYDSQLTLFPDNNIGIFTCVSGPAGEPAYVANILIHYAAADVLLGLQHWLDPRSARTFPEPWKPRETFFPEKIHSTFDKTIRAERPLSHYTGVFHNGFLGDIKIDVVQEGEQETLHMKHGQIGAMLLHPNGVKDEFRIEGVGLLSFVHQVDLNAPSDWIMVHFSGSCDPDDIDTVHWSLVESSPAFHKQT